MDYSEYRDLTPIDNIENGDEYINALTWAFSNKKIKNIALAGPYGSGKSSIIETFLKNRSLSGNFLKVSLATFVESHQESGKKIELSSDEMEKGILKQLFYKVEPKKIPQSRYRKLTAKKIAPVFFFIFAITLFIGLLCAIFVPTTYDYIIDALQFFIQKNLLGVMPTYALALSLDLVIVVIITYVYYFVSTSNIKIKEIKLPKDTTVKSERDDEDSVFNKNLDEIMYFFEVTKYRTVFFEDLDRLDDKKIFVHLHELNNLLNNDDSIKRKPIVFVYAVKDDLFSDEDRTKFFDFIIPVVPIINSTNSGEVLLELLQDSKKNGIAHNIKDNFVQDVSPYISDMRILYNIYNEFVVYKKILKESQKLDLSDEQMLALIIFKNLYPSDFADIQKESGIIKEAFNDKEIFVEAKINSIQTEVDEITKKISTANADALQSLKEIKIAMLVALTEGKGITKFISVNSSGNQSTLPASRILDDTFDLSELTNRKYQGLTYISFSNNSSNNPIPVKNYESIVTPYIDRLVARKELCDNGIECLQSEISQLRERQRRLSRMTIKELMAEYPNCISTKNKFLTFLLRRGYLDENYGAYINYFKGTTITTGDMNFILSVKNQEAKPFDYSLTKAAIVIKRLQDYEFWQKEIYNFDLLDQLLSQDSSADKLVIMIKQLADESETSWMFIDEFIDRTAYLDKFIKLLATYWKRMWFHIATNATLTYDRQILYLVALVKVLNPEELSYQNENDCLVEYFEKHSDILRRLEAAGCDNLQDIIKELKLSFHCLELDDVSDDLQSFIFNGHYYELNWSMVQSIVTFIKKDSLNKLEEQPYSTVISLQYQPLIEDVHKNIDKYTREIILTRESIHDQTEDILALLEQLITIPDLCISLVKREQFCLPHLYDCCMNMTTEYEEAVEEIWAAMLSEKKVDTTWENVISFWKTWSLESVLKDYIADNIDELIISFVDTVPDEFIADFIRTRFSEDVKRKALSVLRMDDFSLEINELDKATLNILIEYQYFDFSASRFSAIRNADVSLSIDYIMGNQREFMDDFAEIEMTSDLFEQVLLDDRLDDDIRRKLFETNVEKYMTANIAAQMNQAELGLHITKAIFDAGWNCLNSDGKEALLYKNLCVLDAEDFERCFTDLGDKYKGFLGRDSSHEVTLLNSENHEKLAVHLKEVGYITSYRKKEEIIYDTILGADKTVNQIKYRIKQIKKEENPNG